MKALVVGGAGFIGSHLADGLRAARWDVVVFDNLSTGSEANLSTGSLFVEGDLGDPTALARVLPGCDAVFHLAADSSVQSSLERPLAAHQANLTNTLALLESCVRHGVRRFVFSSSAAVYGDTGGEPAREDMLPRPLSHYAVQKLASEHYCRVYHHLYGLETVVLRFFNVFGPRQRADSPYSGVIAKLTEAASNNRRMVIYGDGEQTRDFCAVSDVVSATIAAATVDSRAAGGRVFNVGTGRSISINELSLAIAGCFAETHPPEHCAGREGEIRHSRANIGAANEVLGWQPLIDLRDGIALLARGRL
jgi:UDP-glucose 4-epimerase